MAGATPPAPPGRARGATHPLIPPGPQSELAGDRLDPLGRVEPPERRGHVRQLALAGQAGDVLGHHVERVGDLRNVQISPGW